METVIKTTNTENKTKTAAEEGKPGVLIYRSWHDALKQLSGDQYKEAMTLIMEYALDGIEPKTSDLFVSVVLTSIMPQLDSNNRKWIAQKKSREKKKAEKEAAEKAAKQGKALDIMFGGEA